MSSYICIYIYICRAGQTLAVRSSTAMIRLLAVPASTVGGYIYTKIQYICIYICIYAYICACTSTCIIYTQTYYMYIG